MENTATAAGTRHALWINLALIVATLAVYLPVTQSEFLNFDDGGYVTDNSYITAGLTVESLLWVFTHAQSGTWHPLTGLSHMLDCQLFGLHPGAHHAVNLLLHVLNTLLLFAVLRRMTGMLWRSAWVAGAFALHPMHVESVAWIAERKDVLSTCFWMLTLCAYARYVERPRPARYVAMLVLFTFGLMAKPMLVTLPFVLLLLDDRPLRRWPRVSAAWLLVEKLPLMALAATASTITFIVQRRAGAVASLASFSIGQRVANALVSGATYLAKLFWPIHLAVFYPYELPLPAWKLGAAIATLLSVSIGCMVLARRRPYLIVGWLWFLGTLVPVSGIVQVGEQAMADRYTYIPYVGLFLMLAWGLSDALAGWRRARVGLAIAGALALAACGVATRLQVSYWHDSIRLFEHTLAVTHDNHVAYTSLGSALAVQGRAREALDLFAAALRIRPDYANAHLNFGVALAAQGQGEAAIMHYQEALRLDPTYAQAHYDLGIAFAEQGQLDDAISHYQAALRLNPGYAKARINLGWALAQQGKLEAAVAEYRQVLDRLPATLPYLPPTLPQGTLLRDLAAARNSLGVALEGLGKPDAALAEYAEVVRLIPDDPRAHFNLAAALAGQGRIAEAREHYSVALRLDPNLKEAREALAALPAAGGNP